MQRLITFTVILAVAAMTGCGSVKSAAQEDSAPEALAEEFAPPQEGEIGSGEPISRQETARMIALAFSSEKDIQSGEYQHSGLIDAPEASAYYSYIGSVCNDGYMSALDGRFRPEDNLTLTEAQILIDRINPGNKTRIKITDDIKDKPVSYSLWGELYEKAINEGAGGTETCGLRQASLFILDTEGETAFTNEGVLNCAGLELEKYELTEISALIKDSSIVLLKEVKSASPMLLGAYTELGENKVSITLGGRTRQFNYAAENQSVTSIADISFYMGNVGRVDFLTDIKTGRIISADGSYILLDNEKIETDEGFKIYNGWDGSRAMEPLSSLISGWDGAEFYMRNGKAAAAVLTKEPNAPESIRSLISCTGYGGYFHKTAVIRSDKGFSITRADGVSEHSPGETVDIGADLSGRAVVKPAGGGRLELVSIDRACGNPVYRGTLELEKRDEGILIVNDIGIEEYLYSVVPAEMPSYFNTEALKAQAVAARSYAYNQYFANRFLEYGANVDDSTSSQVYNNIGETPESIQAVNETSGLLITNGGIVISANFFSAGCGATANSGEAWPDADTAEFPADTPEYLSSRLLVDAAVNVDLSSEQGFSSFIKAAPEGCEAKSVWYRWSGLAGWDAVSAAVNSELSEICKSSPSMVKVKAGDGIFIRGVAGSVGEVNEVSIRRRGGGGLAMELLVRGSQGEVIICGQYNIRRLLGGAFSSLTAADGSRLEGMELLPSAFFTVEFGEEGISITGGGNGHGVGLSQNGANALAGDGFDFREILEAYYGEVDVAKGNFKS